MKEVPNPLKYKILEEQVTTDDPRVQNYIDALKELITYQYHTIKEQRAEIISHKHKEAWRHYDKQ